MANFNQSFASRLNGLIATIAPQYALRREAALTKRNMLMSSAHYQAAGRGARSKDFRVNRTDAVEAVRWDRDRISYIARDMMRNNARVVKGRRQLTNSVVGAGILPTVKFSDGRGGDNLRKMIEGLIDDHCLTTDFDADGRINMLGQQSVGFGTIVGDGEVLFRRRFRRQSDGYALNFQVQVLETDFLNTQIDGPLANGNYAHQGIEFNKQGQRVYYHLFEYHPGSRSGAGLPRSKRISAENIIHAYDVTRPGQQRGVSWFAPVMTLLHDLQKYQDGQVKRQEIASLFAAVYQTNTESDELEQDMGELSAGSILTIGAEEKMDFTNPPSVEGYGDFMKATDRVIAAALGVTYEGFTGDYSQVNYTSGRMGRMDTDPGIQNWQRNLMIVQICAQFGNWIKEAVQDVADIDPRDYKLEWTPPTRPVVDPTKDYKADAAAVDAGQISRRAVIRRRGDDPVKVEAEILEERKWERKNSVSFRKSTSPAAGSDKGASK